MKINEDLQQNLSAVSKARRLGESKVISAKADVEAAKLMRETVDVLDSEAAMQIRYLEAIQMLASDPVQKILFLKLSNGEDQFKQIEGSNTDSNE